MHSMNSIRIVLAGLVSGAMLTGCQSARISRDRDNSGGHHHHHVPAPQPPHGHVKGNGEGPPAHAPAHGYRRKHQYRYYPDQCVYHCPERSQWFWVEAGSWRVGMELPDSIVLNVDGFVNVELEGEQPYTHHSMVASVYPPRSSDAALEHKHGKGHGKGKSKAAHDQGQGSGNGNGQGQGRAAAAAGSSRDH